MVGVCLALFKCSYQADLSIGKHFINYFNSWLLMMFYCYFIAIIGGGIGGTSCAHFLRKIFKDSVKLDVYEGNKIGGRLATALMNDGNEYETGGSVIHQRNKYMSDFVSKLG